MLTRLPSLLDSGKIKDSNSIQLQHNSNCWLCEGWTQIKFRFEPGVSDDNPEHDPFKPIKLHLQIDQYQGDLMLPDQGEVDGEPGYSCYRMLPPGTHKYFFSIANKPLVAQEQS